MRLIPGKSPFVTGRADIRIGNS